MEEAHGPRVRERALLETERVGQIILWVLFSVVATLALTALTVPLWGWP